MRSTPDNDAAYNNPESRREGLIKATDVLAAAAGTATLGLMGYSVWSNGVRHVRPSAEGALKVLGASALAGALIGAGSSALRGSRWNYESYSPERLARRAGNRPVVIYFSGAAGGNWLNNNPDVTYLDSKFGRGNYVLFGKDSVDDAVTFAAGLPNGTKIRIMGHSMGGPAAYECAARLGDLGIDVNRLDTIDPVGAHMGFKRRELKPANVRRWHNYVPKKYRLNTPGNILAVAGGPWGGALKGAENHVIEGENASHRLIRYEVPKALTEGVEKKDNSSKDKKSTKLSLMSLA